MNKPTSHLKTYALRSHVTQGVFFLAFMGLIAAAYVRHIHVSEDALRRSVPVLTPEMPITATRGRILDRKQNVLASSVVVRAITVSPLDIRAMAAKKLKAEQDLLDTKLTTTQRKKLENIVHKNTFDYDFAASSLSRDLSLPFNEVAAKLSDPKGSFHYLKRQVLPEIAERVAALKIPTVRIVDEFRRDYPEGESMATVLGYVRNTKTDAEGRQNMDGLESTYNATLEGVDGVRRVLRDGKGRIVGSAGGMVPAVQGDDVQLTLDRELQYFAYAALRNGVLKAEGKGGSAVVVDAKTGEILAMANYPSYDPTKPETLKQTQPVRNRAVTDLFEPGSIVKPITLGLAVQVDKLNARSAVSGAEFKVGKLTVKDHHPLAIMTLGDAMERSSNVGTVKFTRPHSNEAMYKWLSTAGFGQPLNLKFGRADSTKKLRAADTWQPVERTTIMYGYGISASLLQLARAYTVFANDGEVLSLSLDMHNNTATRTRLMDASSARLILSLMERVVSGKDGTGNYAQLQDYRAAGKTGTARKIVDGKYKDGAYYASFAGIAPVSNPKIIVAIVIDEPNQFRKKELSVFGGAVAAPVFAEVAASSLRALKVSPDAPGRAILTYNDTTEMIEGEAE